MDASGGRRRVDQGTPPIQSDRMIRLETGHDVWQNTSNSLRTQCWINNKCSQQDSASGIWRAERTFTKIQHRLKGSKIQRRAFSRVIHDYARKKGHNLGYGARKRSGFCIDPEFEATGLCVRPKRESSIRHAERTIIRIRHKGTINKYADPDVEATVSASGASQSQPITTRRKEYARKKGK